MWSNQQNYIKCLMLTYLYVGITQIKADTINIRIRDNCTTPDGSIGTCKYLEECPHMLEFFANPQKQMIKYLEGYLCDSYSPGTVCCTEKSTAREVKLPDKRYCGFQHFDDLMIDLRVTSIIEFPWIAAIMRRNKAGTEEVACLGAVINNRYVLTSGYCAGKQSVWIRLGEFHIQNKTDCVTWKNIELEECNEFEDFEIEEAIPHPFMSNALVSINDIGLLRLNRSVSYSDYVRPICLPTAASSPLKPGDTLYTSGWTDNQIKRKIASTLTSSNECYNPDDINFNKYSMCIKYQTKNGQSVNKNCHLLQNGAPVMFSSHNQWHIEGISNVYFNSNGSCIARYTPILTYMDWIRHNLRA